jgi:uncharacterized protein with PIN domain
MATAIFRFYAELNDFLPLEKRQRSILYRFRGAPAVKDAIEALGVPHTEVDLVIANGCSVDFTHQLQEGERISVYPIFESLDITPLVRLSERPLRRTAFIADVHLRKLARLLRLLGFDTVHSNDCADREIIARAAEEERIILTRDRALLKHNAVTHGYWVRSVEPLAQAREVVQRFDLRDQVQPFRRCVACNGSLIPVDKQDILSRIPPKTARWLDEYFICRTCDKLYWRGTHVPNLQEMIRRILENERSRGGNED